jgi:excinuclease ABC subunit C
MPGIEIIKDALKTMPERPGIYQMLSEAGDILYIGKAKNLKNRVSNYASANGLSNRIMRMVQQVASVAIVQTQNEAEALLMEAALVKRHQPRYNVLLKDDKSFPYIAFSGNHPFPRLKKHRGAQAKDETYFGPFPSTGAVNHTLALLQKVFLLRPCSDSIFKNRTRPCLQYQIKRCSAPCVGYVNEQEYAELLKKAGQFLRGKNQEVQRALAQEMQQASEAMDYEKAAHLRDRIRALTQVQNEQSLHAADIVDADMIVMQRSGDQTIIQVVIFRAGLHFGHHSYFPRHASDAADSEVIGAFIGQFYQQHIPAPELLLSHHVEGDDVLEDALSLTAGYRVHIKVPERGDKKQLMQSVGALAMQALQRHTQAAASTRQHLEKLAELFALPAPPERIEVYDNSHVMGTHAVGAMIVATPEGFDKKSFRKFNMENDFAGDDYGMMRAMLTRRFTRALEEHTTLPDLLLIDGGKGQLSAAHSVLETLQLTQIPLVAIAKGEDRNAGREWFFMEGKAPFQLPENDATLHYLQRLRDEAHRFAITAHRGKRSRAIRDSALDDIPGIGAMRKRALLTHFGSRKAVEAASLHELTAVQGISAAIAQKIVDYFAR